MNPFIKIYNQVHKDMIKDLRKNLSYNSQQADLRSGANKHALELYVGGLEPIKNKRRY